MTPRERWDAAVRLQHQIADEIGAAPLTEDLSAALLDKLNSATWELDQSYRAYDPDASVAAAEWSVAYNLHRNALLAFVARRRPVAVASAIEAVRADSVALALRATATVGSGS